VWDDFPADGTNDAFYLSTIELRFSTIVGDETVELSQGGVPVSGTTTVDGERVVFTPDAPLSPSTTYEARYTWCAGTGALDTSWTTSEVGDPVNANSLVGRTYELDLANGRWVEPLGIGSMLGGLLGDEAHGFIGVTQATSSEISFMAAPSDGNGNQDFCATTYDFPVASDFTANPAFLVEADALDLVVDGLNLTLEDMAFSGAFSPDGSYIDGVMAAGTIDVNVLTDLVGDDPCDLLAAVGVACEECSDGSGPHCLSVLVDSLTAPEVPGVTLVQQTTADIDTLAQQGVCDYPSTSSGSCSIVTVGLTGGPLAWLLVLGATGCRRRR